MVRKPGLKHESMSRDPPIKKACKNFFEGLEPSYVKMKGQHLGSGAHFL